METPAYPNCSLSKYQNICFLLLKNFKSVMVPVFCLQHCLQLSYQLEGYSGPRGSEWPDRTCGHVCVCRLLYLAHPDEACYCLRGETLNPIACHWYRQLIPSAAALPSTFSRAAHSSGSTRRGWDSPPTVPVELRVYILWYRDGFLMGLPISPVRGTSGNHEARRKKTARGECPRGAC